ncbi:MAG TPA: choloylglycine hydrolase family protein [Coriobacteriia bacterium]|nr:choloylglycine hydrolase family protein [Coriobacteriia bacterium]
MCTSISIKNLDGSITYGRTMEWGVFDLHSRVVFVPAGIEFRGNTPEGANGIQWTSRIPAVGLDMVGDERMLSDGINVNGLAVGLLYHPGYAEYPPYQVELADISLGPADLVAYLLTQCSTVAEVRDAMSAVRVVGTQVPSLGAPATAHYIVVEPSGDAIVIEFDGETKIFEDPVRVLTNAPTFDWHTTNLRNYVNLSPTALPARELASLNFAPLGAGSGWLSLPGDFTPPSRFVRAVAWSQTARPTANGTEGIYEIFRELDNFNVPLGSAEGSGDGDDLEGMRSSTIWTVAYDLSHPTMYYHTQHNRRVRKVDVTAVDFEGMNSISTIELDVEKTQDIEDRTPGRVG